MLLELRVLHSCIFVDVDVDVDVDVEVIWSSEAIVHLVRSKRYPGAIDIDPAWAAEAVADEGMVEVDPYWASRVRTLAMIGYSPSCAMVLLVLAYRDLHDALHGLIEWPTTGRALREHTERNQQ